MEGPPSSAERVEALCASVRRLAAYAPECVACLTGPLGGRQEPEGRALVISALQQIAGVADEHGVRIGFEPINPHQRDAIGFVHTAAERCGPARRGRPAAGRRPGRHVQPLGRRGRGRVVRGARRPHRRDPRRRPGRRPTISTGGFPARSGLGRASSSTAARSGGWDGTLDVEIFSTPEQLLGASGRRSEAARRSYARGLALAPGARSWSRRAVQTWP